ncbi:MAG: response regulator [Schwartzia succinivorans]|nr:response regulator [Schwartzia succinivorans]
MDYQVILVENNRLMLERLSSVIRGTSGFSLAARYQQAGDALGQSAMFKPNIILLDIDEKGNLSLVPEFASAFPGAAILCISSHWDAKESDQIAQAGAKGYLVKPFSSEELTEAVQTFSKSGMAQGSEVLAFFSPKGKSGKTTLIANLAMSLAARSGEPVGIIDADLQFGDMAVFFNLEPKSTIVEATRDIKFLSPITLNPYFMAVPEAENIRVLCGTKKPEFAEMVEIAPFEDLVRMAQSLFRYVLIDLPPGFNPISVASAELADTTYMVAMVGGGFEVLHMKRALDVFKAWPDYEQRVKTIFTRVSPCTEKERELLEQELGYPVSSIMPNEYLLVSAAANSGRMAVDVQPDTPLSKNINRLSKDIMGRRIQWGAP